MKANKTSKGYDLNYIQYLNDSSLVSDIKEEKKPQTVYLGGWSGTQFAFLST